MLQIISAHGLIDPQQGLHSRDQALLISEGRIQMRGGIDELKSHTPEAQLKHYEGYIYPGFRDPHCHFLYLGLQEQEADLRSCNSWEETAQRLLLHAGNSDNLWIEGKAWNEVSWPEHQQPQQTAIRERLDELFGDRPVYLRRVDGHAALVNSAALNLAGIQKAGKVPGGLIHELEGKPSGLLIDASMELVRKHIPDPDEARITAALLKAQEICQKHGLVGATDMGLPASSYEIIHREQQSGSLRMRINGTLSPDDETQSVYRKSGPYRDDWLQIRAFKYYADGALGSRGAKLLAPYEDDPGTGLWMHDPQWISEQAQLNLEQGFQTVTHAIGDAAVRKVLDIYEPCLQHGDDLRWRIEHVQIVHPDDFNRLLNPQIINSVQACHGLSDREMAPLRLGERLQNAYPGKSLLDAGAHLVNGTDFPIESPNALRSFATAAHRVDPFSGNLYPFEAHEALGVSSALQAMTNWAAHAAFQESDWGTLNPGMWADLTILDSNLFETEALEIPKVQVLATWVGGQCCYQP
jgi:predicted amidohydrolase YtcJ